MDKSGIRATRVSIRPEDATRLAARAPSPMRSTIMRPIAVDTVHLLALERQQQRPASASALTSEC